MKKLVLCVALVLLSRGRAHADEDPSLTNARIHLRAGMADYDEGRYPEAAAEMEQAYALKPVPDLQYNLGQCYDRVGRLEDAAKAYEAFLAGKPGSPETAVVHKRIANLRARAQAQAEGRTDLPPRIEEKVVFKTLVVYREIPPPPGRAARVAAYGLAALGVAGLATGIAFAVLTTQASSAVQDGGNVGKPPVYDGPIRAKADAARLYPIGTGVGFGVAALAVGSAVGLYLYSRKIDREAARAREHDDTASRGTASPFEQARVDGVAPFYVRSAYGATAGISVAGRF